MMKTYRLITHKTGHPVEVAEFSFTTETGLLLAYKWLKEPKKEDEIRGLLQNMPVHIGVLQSLVQTNQHLEALEFNYIPSFEEWWKIWHKKVRKIRAEKAWAKMNDAERVLAFEKAHVPYKNANQDLQYMPDPDKWLMEKRWEEGLLKRG